MRQQRELGRDGGQPVLTVSGAASALGTGREVLPSLEGIGDKPRPMWKHPAFIVSMILTFLALTAAAVFIILSILNPGTGEVKSAAITESTGNVQITWKGNGPVELYVVTNDQALDITQLITGEREAWVPAALNLYTQSSCFVVRPASDKGEEVSIDGATLAKQNAAAVCIGDTVPVPESESESSE